MKTRINRSGLNSKTPCGFQWHGISNRLLPELLAVAFIAVASDRCLLAQGLQVVTSPFLNNSTLSGAAIIAGNDIWAVGDIAGSTASAEATLAEHFDGTSWIVIPTPVVSGSMFSSVSGTAANDVWAVGTLNAGGSGNTLIEHWDGSSWTVVDSPKVPKGSFLTGVAAIAPTDAWAVGSKPAPSNSSFIFDPLVEHWNGTSWSFVTSPVFVNGLLLKGISADAGKDVWIAGGTTVLHFDGANWNHVPSPTKDSLNSISVLSPTNVWGAGVGPGLYFPRAITEHWDGTTWSLVSSPNPSTRGNSFLEGIAAAAADNVWAVGGGTGVGPVTEHWDGQSWTIVTTPSAVRSLNSVTAHKDGTVVAVGVGINNSAVILHN